MKLSEALQKYTELQKQREDLTKQLESSALVLLDVGKKVFSLVRKTNGGIGESCQFQVGDSQYSVSAGGDVKMINVVKKVDGELSIE